MSGFRAPKINTVRIGYIGIGNRGSGAVKRIVNLENIEVKAICDVRKEQVEDALVGLKKSGQNPDAYIGDENEWKKVCERPDIDLIYICTPWSKASMWPVKYRQQQR